ncbi:MAG: prepilin-type N-terminal cleavage/methylation domain-containing protein [Candidatus Spechtbacterales bacterium]
MTGSNRFEKGFTLIELVVALGVFSIVMMIAFGAFLGALRAQRVTFAEHSVSQETRFALEFMSRQLRVASQDGGGGGSMVCLDASNSTPRVFDVGAGEIQFLNGREECVRFFFDDGTGTIRYENPAGGTAYDLTSPTGVTVESLQFTIRGNTNADDEQPRVMINLTARGLGGEEEEAARLTTQTTVTVRTLDLP